MTSVCLIEKPAHVEIVQDKQLEPALAAEFLDQRPRRGDAHALGRHDREVEPLGDPGRFEDLGEALLFQKQDRAVAAVRPHRVRFDGRDAGVENLRFAKLGNIVPHRQRAETDLAPSMGFAEVATIVPGDVPGGGTLGDDFRDVRAMVFGPDERRTIADMRRSGAVEARRGGASDQAIGNKLGNAFASNRMINETYGPTDLATVRQVDAARRLARTGIGNIRDMDEQKLDASNFFAGPRHTNTTRKVL